MNNRNRMTLLMTAGLTVVALAGCGGTTSSEPAGGTGGQAAAPEGDGSLTLYAGRSEELIAPLIEQFTEATGIEVEARYGSSAELNALLLEEGENSPAQVFLSQDAGALGSLSNAGLAAELPAELADLIPAGFTSEDSTWLGVTGRARVLAYDSENVSEDEVPDSVADLTAEEWKGRVGFPPGNASFQSFLTAYRVLEGEEAANDWVEQMSANEPELTESNGTTLDLVNSGQLDLALVNHYYWFEDAAEIGEDAMRAQLKFLPGDPGGMVNVTGASILQGAAGDPDALAFLEYLVSEEGQSYFVENTYEYPLLPGVDAPAGLPPLDELVNPELDLSDLDSLEQTQELLATHGLL